MLEIPIQAIPNQEFSFLIDAVRYTMALVTLNDNAMAATITRNDVVLITCERIVSGAPLLPYQYLVADHGNFSFVTVNDEAPYWTEFNATQRLIFATPGEIANV